jgi:hypothetical protein
MLSFAYYLLQVAVCSAVMMGYYWLVLRNKRFHQYNRFYLLGVALLSWVVPVIKIRIDSITSGYRVMQLLWTVADNNSYFETTTDKGFQVNWNLLVVLAYAIVSVFFLLSLLIALNKIGHLLKNGVHKNLTGVYLVFTRTQGTPFSFFKYIFWNEDVSLQTTTSQQILRHELVHVREMHSIDKIILKVVMIAGWYNPLFWLVKSELEMIHEFIADHKAIKDRDTALLAEMLLSAVYPQQYFMLTNPFFFSPVKRRLFMFVNNKKPRYSYARRVIILPLMAVIIILFAFRKKADFTLFPLNRHHETESYIVSGNTTLFIKELKDTDHIPLGGKSPAMIIVHKADGNKDTVINGTSSSRLDKIMTGKGKEPLYMVDGKQIAKGGIKEIKPENIFSVNILKGNAAVEKYGNKGTNGVIEITTKSSFRESLPEDYQAFLHRNREVKYCQWTRNPSTITMKLNDGSLEVYYLENSQSRQKAIDKYGQLPVVPVLTRVNIDDKEGIMKYDRNGIWRNQSIEPD